MPSITDLFARASNGSGMPVPTTLASSKGSGATSMSVTAVTNWPTTTCVNLLLFTLLADGKTVTPGSVTEWKGILSGTTVGSLTLKGGVDTTYPSGSQVVLAPTNSWADDLFTGLTQDHSVVGQHVQLTDTNGKTILALSPTASAVNELQVANAATGSGPTLAATGSDTNIDINFAPKGTGAVKGIANHLYNPYKFHYYRAGALTPTTGTVIVFDTEVFDTSGNYSLSTGRFTATVPGFYWFNAQLNLETSAINQNLQTLLYKNGARAISGSASVNMYNGPTSIWCSVATGIIQLAVGDYATTVVLSDNEAMAVAGTGSQNFFQGFLVSAT